MNTRYVPIETIEEPTTRLKPAMKDPLEECHAYRSGITGQEKDNMFDERGPEILFNEATDLAAQNSILIEVIQKLDKIVPGIFNLKLLAHRQYEATAAAAESFTETADSVPFRQALSYQKYLKTFAGSRAGIETQKGWRTGFMMAAQPEGKPQLYMAQTDMVEGFNNTRVRTEALITDQAIAVRRNIDTPSIAMGFEQEQDFKSLKDPNRIRNTLQAWGKSPTGSEHPVPNPEGTKLVIPRRFFTSILPENKATLTIPHLTSEKEIEKFIRDFAFEIQLILMGSTNPQNVAKNLQRQNPLHMFRTPIHPIYTDPHPMYDREE